MIKMSTWTDCENIGFPTCHSPGPYLLFACVIAITLILLIIFMIVSLQIMAGEKNDTGSNKNSQKKSKECS